MMMTNLLLQIDSLGTLAAAAIFFVILAVVAMIAFKILKKTVKMALRMTIVVAILLIAVLGSFSLWWFNSGATPSSRSGSGSSRPR